MKNVQLMPEKEKQWKGDFLVKSSNILITIGNVLHQSSHFIFTNKNYVFLSVSSTVKVVNVASYHITI